MEWNKENTLFFIKLFRERPVLWDVTLEDHKDKYKKKDALSEIAKIIGITKEEVNSKWTSLKGQYNREKKKVTGLKTGSGAADIYISKWFAYLEMASLVSCNIPQESISNYAVGIEFTYQNGLDLVTSTSCKTNVPTPNITIDTLQNNGNNDSNDTTGDTQGHHGSNLLRPFQTHHVEEFVAVTRTNMANKGKIIHNDEDGTKILEAIEDNTSLQNLKEEAVELDNEECDGYDPLQSSDEEYEPPPKLINQSKQVKIEHASSSKIPDVKPMKKYNQSPPGDEFDAFGKNVALKLRNIAATDEKQRLMAEKIINDALFVAEMGALTLAHCNKLNLE